MNQCDICRIQTKNKKFCSYDCYWQSKKGKPSWNKGLSQQSDKRLQYDRPAAFKVGHILKNGKENNWKIVKCKICQKEFKEVFSRIKTGRGKYCSKKCANVGKRGFVPKNFKGDDVGYDALHDWVKRWKGKAKICIFCQSITNVQWANKSHEYKRDLEDWLSLCYKCHRVYDRKNGWGKATLKFPELRRK